MARKDLTGQKFNHLTVLKLDEERSNKKRTYCSFFNLKL